MEDDGAEGDASDQGEGQIQVDEEEDEEDDGQGQEYADVDGNNQMLIQQ